MSLKNVLIIVDNIDESIDFYEELFGLRVITRMEGNVIMSEGLVLQDVDARQITLLSLFKVHYGVSVWQQQVAFQNLNLSI